MKVIHEIHVSQRMNPTDFDDLPSFPLMWLWSSILWFRVKYLYSYCADCNDFGEDIRLMPGWHWKHCSKHQHVFIISCVSVRPHKAASIAAGSCFLLFAVLLVFFSPHPPLLYCASMWDLRWSFLAHLFWALAVIRQWMGNISRGWLGFSFRALSVLSQTLVPYGAWICGPSLGQCGV